MNQRTQARGHRTLRLAATALALALYLALRTHYLWLYTPTTLYADGYNEARFSTVTIGMSRTNVVATLGSPRRIFTIDGITFLAYSDIGHYTSVWQKVYYQRWIAIGKNDVVIHVFSQTLTTDDDPCYPVLEERLDGSGTWQSRRTQEFANR